MRIFNKHVVTNNYKMIKIDKDKFISLIFYMKIIILE